MIRRPKYHKEDRPKPKGKKRVTATCDPAWRIRRASMLQRFPECRCGQMATEVDHIDNDDANNEWDNLRTMCKSCHSKKTVREDGGLGHANS